MLELAGEYQGTAESGGALRIAHFGSGTAGVGAGTPAHGTGEFTRSAANPGGPAEGVYRRCTSQNERGDWRQCRRCRPIGSAAYHSHRQNAQARHRTRGGAHGPEQRAISTGARDGGRRMKPLANAFCTALLLTADVASAEAAVLEAIRNSDCDPLRGVSFREVIERSVGPARGAQGPSDPPPVPAELQGVLRLSPHLRHCFVLRILLNFSRRACAEMLRLHVRQVDRYTCEAMASLPVVREQPNLQRSWTFSMGEQEICYEQS